MNTVLYYPYITPKPDWLKLAALCWEKVYRIVPEYGQPNDADVIKEIDEALGGILEAVDVRPYGREVEQQFWDWVDAREEELARLDFSPEPSDERNAVFGLFTMKFSGEEFVEELESRGLARFNPNDTEIVREVRDWDWVWDWRPQSEQIRRRDDPPHFHPARQKYEDLLEEARDNERRARRFEVRARRTIFPFMRKGREERAEAYKRKAQLLGAEAEDIRQQEVVETFEQPIVYLPKDVALHYLSLCASDAANDEGRDLFADGAKFTDAVFHEYSVRGEVGTAVLEAYLPENFSDLEPERIKEFRNDFSAQRLKYQTAVQDIVDQYKNTASEGTLETIKKQIEELAKEEVNETKKTYQRANQRMVLKTFGMSLTPPAIATVIASALGVGIFAPAGIVAAVSLFGAGLLLDRDEAQSEMHQSPWSYVLDAAKL